MSPFFFLDSYQMDYRNAIRVLILDEIYGIILS